MKKIFSTLFVLLAGMTAFAQDATLTVKDVEIEAGQEATLSINLTGAEQFIAAGMYVTFPEGVTAATKKSGDPKCKVGMAAFDEDEEEYTHNITAKLQNPTTLKFAVASMANAAFYADGELASFTITCDENLAAGTYEGALKTIEFSKADRSGLFKMEDQTFTINVVNPVGIETLSADKAQISEVYSVSGAQQNGLQKGINIVKFANGEVKKVIVK